MTALIDGKIWLALLSRITAWTETPVMLPDSIFNPTANQAYLIVQPVNLSTDDRTIQFDCGDEFRGILNISVMAPLGWSYSQHVGLASRVCDFFLAGAVYTYQDARVTIYSRARSLGAPRLDQSWNRVEVQVPWRAWG